ncbi:VWA domain-containing protein [Kroppenstedtia eburnea]|uniref:VWA domain-containing protein n=1 Tax=Kroppenstedtia eburnea TaxID=714067 RepID=UPI00363061EA
MEFFKNVIALVCILTLIGCSSEDVKGTGNSNSKRENAKIPTKVEDMIAQGPGKYAGDNYDEGKVKAELDKISANASKEEVYNTVMNLLAEDFASVKKSFDQIDTTYTIDSNTPGTDVKNPSIGQYNVSILLDASGSMAAQVSGGRKMDVAKDAVETFVSTFPEEANVSLIAYGHKGSNSKKDKQLSCSEINEIYPLGTYEKSTFSNALKSVDATGWTPLADAIKKSGETLKANANKNSKNVVYIVSDGLETCGGNPAKEAEALQKDGISATVNIIGFDVNNAEQQALKEVAEAGGGTFTTANSKSDLESYFKDEYTSLRLEWFSYSTLTVGDIVEQRTQKENELNKTKDTYLAMIDREKENVDKAIAHLKEKGKSMAVDYNERNSKIDSYLWKIYEKLDGKIYHNGKDLIDKVEGEADKNLNELDEKRDGVTNSN